MKPLVFVLPLAASLAIAQQPQGTRYPISTTAIAKFLQAHGTKATSSQIHLPMQLTATIPEPHFEIARTRRVADHELDLEVHCQSASECLPFRAMVDVNDSDTVSAAVNTEDSLNRPARQSSVEAVIHATSLPTEPAAPAPDLRVGAQAVLVIIDGRMRIHLPVIAMDSGSQGTSIRVCTLDRKRIFHAVVVNGETVQGALQ